MTNDIDIEWVKKIITQLCPRNMCNWHERLGKTSFVMIQKENKVKRRQRLAG